LDSCTLGKSAKSVDKSRGEQYDRSVVNESNPMVKITKKQLDAAEGIIYKYVQDPYARHEGITQLYQQVKLLKKLGSSWASNGEPAVTFCIKGRFDMQLSKAVSEALGL